MGNLERTRSRSFVQMSYPPWLARIGLFGLLFATSGLSQAPQGIPHDLADFGRSS